jgi:hypothetical protein
VREFVERKLPQVQTQAKAEDAQPHFVDEVGVKAQDQIGTSYAPEGETAVLKVPRRHIEQNVISSVTPEGELFCWPFPGTMTAPKFIDFLERLVSAASTKLIVFADWHPAHEAQAVAQWLEGREDEIDLHWLPRYAPESNPDAFLNNDLKQELANEPMPESTSGLRDTIGTILDRIARMSDRIRGYFKQAKINQALN